VRAVRRGVRTKHQSIVHELISELIQRQDEELRCELGDLPVRVASSYSHIVRRRPDFGFPTPFPAVGLFKSGSRKRPLLELSAGLCAAPVASAMGFAFLFRAG
jgi:hypothetical protein